ncbi:MAG TPA: hypothetical protein DEV81_09070, partial [Cyanobacteria bacterium UBA11049]|nr:hypothetical protein [Cyanobacteria bacterium UBA11049]
LLIAFGFTVQRDYILSTQYQQGFWTDVSRLCPDMTQDTVILVEDASLARVEHMNPFAGQFARILGFIYKFPEAWIEPDNLRQSSQPKVLRLNSNWQANILIDNNLLRLDRKTLVKTRRNTPKSQLNSTNVIFLQAHQGQLVRKTDSLVIDDKTAQFKQNSSNLKMPPFEKGVLYPYLINDLSNQSINYLSTGSQEEATDQYEDENSI